MMEEEVAAGLEKMAGMTMPVTFKDSDGDVIKLILAAGNMQLLVNGEEAIDDCTVLYTSGNTIEDSTGQQMEHGAPRWKCSCAHRQDCQHGKDARRRYCHFRTRLQRNNGTHSLI